MKRFLLGMFVLFGLSGVFNNVLANKDNDDWTLSRLFWGCDLKGRFKGSDIGVFATLGFLSGEGTMTCYSKDGDVVKKDVKIARISSGIGVGMSLIGDDLGLDNEGAKPGFITINFGVADINDMIGNGYFKLSLNMGATVFGYPFGGVYGGFGLQLSGDDHISDSASFNFEMMYDGAIGLMLHILRVNATFIYTDGYFSGENLSGEDLGATYP